MTKIGIICEYNPFHKGHAAQIRRIRAEFGEDCAVICLMSGNYVQRGEPAIFPKVIRAEAAILGGADLVLELPLTVALSSAEGFADGGVRILTALGCDALSFGTECGDPDLLMDTARLLLQPEIDERLRFHLQSGCSYPAARELALRDLGGGEAVSLPNDILGVEYCKAILRRRSPMRIHTFQRPGDYHAQTLDPENPSATALRSVLRILRDGSFPVPDPRKPSDDLSDWVYAVPEKLRPLYDAVPIYTMTAGERAVLAVLRTLPDAAFEALPYGSEGLWSKFMKNCRTCVTVGDIVWQTKSKRYTCSRIQRMLLCAYLGLTEEDLKRVPSYVRILAFNDRGRAALREMKDRFPLVNAGQTPSDAAYYALECHAADMYGLFHIDYPGTPGSESRQRVRYFSPNP